GLQGDGTTTNARGDGGSVRNTDKRSTQLTMETPYARVSSDTRLTLDLHISEKQGRANSLLGETPGSRRRDFTGTGNSGRAQELYPAFALDLRNEASTNGGNDTPRTSTDGDTTTPRGNTTTRTTTDGNTATPSRNNGQPGGQQTGNRTAPENPSNDNYASLTDMARSLTPAGGPGSRDAFNDALTLLASVENKGKDILDLGRIVLAKSWGWNPPADAVSDGRYTPEAVGKAADYVADKLKLNSRNNAIDQTLTELGIKASFAEAGSETGAELPELGPTTWMMRAVSHPETARIKDYNPSMRLTDSSETGRTFSPFHNESSTTTMGFEARPSGRTGTGPPTTATHYGSANNTGSSTSGGDTARGSKPKEPPHSDRVRTGPGYLVEMDTDVFIGARTELSGPWYKRSARYVGDKAASAGRAVRGAFGGRSTPSSVPTRPARWQQGGTTVKTTRWISHGDAVRTGIITPDHANRIAPLTERFAAIQQSLADAEKAYLNARWPLDKAASDRIASPDDPQVQARYRNLETTYEDRREDFDEAVRNWVTALRELRDGLGDLSSLPRPRTATAPALDTIQEEPSSPPAPAPQQNALDPAADPEAVELPERQPGQEGRQPEQDTEQRDTDPNLLDTLGSALNIRPREAGEEEAPPQPPQRNTPDPATTELPERDNRPQEDVPRQAPEPSAAEVLERARQKLARDTVMGRALQGQDGSSRNETAPADNRPERHSRNQSKGPLSHTDHRSGPSSETHARPESATVRRPRVWATPTGEDGNGPSRHEAALPGDQAETRRGPAPERADSPADRYTANDEENLYDVSDDEEEAPRPRWLDRHYPEAASLSGEERRELMRSLMERSLAVGPAVPEGFRYDTDLGGPDDIAWIEARGAQRFPPESDTTALLGPPTAPSAPQQQDRPAEDRDQQPQPAPSEEEMAAAALDAVLTFDGQRLPLHTETGPDHGTDLPADQDSLSEASTPDSDTLRDMRLRLERLRSSSPAPSEGDRPSPADTGPTGDHGRQSSPDRTGRASEEQPAPRRPQTPDLPAPSTNPDRSEWDNRLRAMHDWRANWQHRARTPEEEDRLRQEWRARWSLPATTRPGGSGPSQHGTEPFGGRAGQGSPDRAQTSSASESRPVPPTETAREEPRSPVPTGTDPGADGRSQDRATAQPARSEPGGTPAAPSRPHAGNLGGEGFPALSREQTVVPQQEGAAPPAEQAPLISGPAADLFAFFAQELNGPAGKGDGDSAQGTTRTPSGEETTAEPAPVIDDDRTQEASSPETAPDVAGTNPSRKQSEGEDQDTPENEDGDEENSEDDAEDAPGSDRKKDNDEDGAGGGAGSSGHRSGGDGGNPSGGNSADRSGSGDGDRPSDRSAGDDGSEGNSGGPAPQGDGSHSSAQPRSDSATAPTGDTPAGTGQNPSSDAPAGAEEPGQDGTQENQGSDDRPAVEALGLEDRPDGDPRFPSDLSNGRVIGTIPENRTGRDDNDRIITVDGKPLQDFQSDLLIRRAEEVKKILRGKTPVRVDTGTFHNTKADRPSGPDADPFTEAAISFGDQGGRNGAVNAIVVDRVSGKVAEGHNGRTTYSVIPEDELHPKLKERFDAMYSDGGYQVYGADGNPVTRADGSPETTPYPFNDLPARHAELKALNALLWERDGAEISDFQLDAWFTLKNDGSL
ncbi:hypothetical protein Q7689_05060, partial [Nocardiopsis tropica]|nr:hypothetical protein [Nocardiopsis tropica]